MTDQELSLDVNTSIATIITIEEEAQKYQEKYKELTKKADEMRDKIKTYLIGKDIKSVKHSSGCTVSIVNTKVIKVKNELDAIEALESFKVDSFIVKTVPKHVEIDEKELSKWIKEHDIHLLKGVDITERQSLRIAN